MKIWRKVTRTEIAKPTAGRRATPTAGKRRAEPTAGTETKAKYDAKDIREEAAASQYRSIQEPTQMSSRGSRN